MGNSTTTVFLGCSLPCNKMRFVIFLHYVHINAIPGMLF